MFFTFFETRAGFLRNEVLNKICQKRKLNAVFLFPIFSLTPFVFYIFMKYGCVHVYVAIIQTQFV